MVQPDEIALFYDRCSDLMRELLDGLAAAPESPRPFPAVEQAIGWPPAAGEMWADARQARALRCARADDPAR